MSDNKEVTFGLVHGSWHGAWCWGFLQEELERLGYESVAMDLPIEDPTANFEDYANVVVDALRDKSNLVLVGHSRAGNVIPRAAARLATSKLIYLCASFEPATIGHPTAQERHLVPPRNTEIFQRGIITMADGLTRYDPSLAKELFYNDCTPEIQEWAVNQLRQQRRSAIEPVIHDWPNITQEYIVCNQDLVVNPSWSRYAATAWLGIEPVEMSSGHSPFLSRPKELAATLISLAE